jgi:hypothetical protein
VGSVASIRRWIVCAGVFAGHLAAVFLLSYHRSVGQSSQSELSMDVIWLPQSPQLLERPEQKPVGTSKRLKEPAVVPAPAAPLESAPSPLVSERPTTAITDWDAAAQGAADEVLRQERERAARRSFEHTFAKPGSADKPGVFGSQKQNDRAGLVEEGERFWVNHDCYFDIPRGAPPPRIAGEYHLLTRTCKPPPTGGGERMFENLTPDYLKKLPVTHPTN